MLLDTYLHAFSNWFNFALNLVASIREEKSFNLQSVKPTFLSFFSVCSTYFDVFILYKIWNTLKVNNKDTRIRRVNNKVKNKDTADVVLVSLLLTLNTFHFFLQCFCHWPWSVNSRLGLFVVLTFCDCWEQFRQSFPLWRNQVNILH